MKRLGLLLFLCTAGLQAQTVAAPIPVANQQFLDCRTGVCLPLVGGKLYSYAAGTVTPLVTYTDSGGATPNANPVVLNASGYNTAGGGNAGVWIRGACYKFILKDVADVTLWTQDNVCNQDALTKAALLATYASTAGASLIGYKSAATGSVATTLAKKAAETVSAQSDFGAKGDDSTDDTAAIQACIDYSANNRASCFIPPAIYKTAGAGLHMLSGFPSVYSTQPAGDGVAVIKYYGTATALTIGDNVSQINAVNLRNIAILVATGVSAQYGINARIVAGGDWGGLTVGSLGTGKFTGANIRMVDSGLLDLRNVAINNQNWTAGTTGILFDTFGVAGNYNITVSGGLTQFFALANDFNFKSCTNCIFRDGWSEGFDYDSLIDNTVAQSGMNNVVFDGWSYLADLVGAGPTHRKILQVNSTTGNNLVATALTYKNCRMQLVSGVTYPFELNIPSTGASSLFNLILDQNTIAGVVGAVVDSDNAIASVYFGINTLSDNGGAGSRPPDLNGIATVSDLFPQNASQSRLRWNDPSGGGALAGSASNNMIRPPAGSFGSGVQTGVSGLSGNPYNNDGFQRVGAGGGLPLQGLSDITSGGSSSGNHVFVVQITASGAPDVFQWSVDNGAFTTGVSITGAAQALSAGVTITFAATTGHTVNQTWGVVVSSGAIGPATRTGAFPVYNTYCDFSGFSNVTEMNQNITCFIGNSEFMRLGSGGTGGHITLLPVAVSALSACVGANDGRHQQVNDANTTLTLGIGTAVAGGGANHVPVVCDGGAGIWRIG